MTEVLARLFARTLLAVAAAGALPSHALGQQPFVAFGETTGAVALVHQGRAAAIYIDSSDHAGVIRAAGDLQADIERVSSVRPSLAKGMRPTGSDVVIVGTLGKSALIDALAKSGALDVSALEGKWEGWLIQSVERPMAGVDRALVIAGSDKRGTIFGVYEVSEQIGVSPWYWWADVPVKARASLFVAAGTRVADSPVVRYRGIFLNDEEPALSGWVKARYGGYNHEFYTKVFELILRLRGNYLWPAMWNSAFFDDDPLNGKLADEYGIVMGTSHHEPMMRAQREWHRHGTGPWDYESNAQTLNAFWAGGIANTRAYEKVVTLGMRGDGDMPMSPEANVTLLERIVRDQRALIAKGLDPDMTRVPQAWALYKEVQEYYERGMRVPDDVLLLWCDDNWGNIRRLPTAAERKRAGGAGVYYHFDYVGGPRSYKWVNVTPLPKIWEQMHLAWRYEATRMWIVNVGDLKPMEVPMEFFLHYAWDPARWPAARLGEYLRLWAAREFGPAHAGEIADIVAKYTKYNGRRKPEMLEPTPYSLIHYREAERVVAEYNDIAARAQRLSAELPAASRDAFFQLVLYPVRAGAVVNELHVTAAVNRLHGVQGRASTNDLAARVRELFALDAELTRQYHEDIAGGKWNHMMSQTHIGYTSWNQPPRNTMPAVTEVQASRAAEMGVAVEGSDQPSRGARGLALPALDPYGGQSRYLEIFNRGEAPFRFSIAASEPWIELSKSEGTIARGERIFVGARWAGVPADAKGASLVITGPEGRRITVQVPVSRRDAPVASGRFVETGGVVVMEAENYTRAVAPPGREWLRIPDHGRTLSGMTVLPVDAPAPADPRDAMRLEYDLHLFTAGKVSVTATLAPTQKFQPGEGLRFAISFDDEAPRIVNMHADESRGAWGRVVTDGAATFTTAHALDRAGPHTLKAWALDPGLVLQKLVVDTGGLMPSYLGPPQSPRAP